MSVVVTKMQLTHTYQDDKKSHRQGRCQLIAIITPSRPDHRRILLQSLHGLMVRGLFNRPKRSAIVAVRTRRRRSTTQRYWARPDFRQWQILPSAHTEQTGIWWSQTMEPTAALASTNPADQRLVYRVPLHPGLGWPDDLEKKIAQTVPNAFLVKYNS
jgi:hypothetical protein